MIRILSEQIPDYESVDSILREIFKGLADFVPNFEERTLTVWLRPLAVGAHNEALLQPVQRPDHHQHPLSRHRPSADLRYEGSSLTRAVLPVRICEDLALLDSSNNA